MPLKFIGIPFFILRLTTSTYKAYAQNASDNRVIISHNQNSTNTLTNVHSISFYELPLWIKIAYASTIILSIFALLKIIPFFLGRLKNVLDNPTRNSIFNFIKSNPGGTISEISKEENVNRGTLRYHLRMLLENRKVIFVKKGKSIHIFNKYSQSVNKNDLWLYLRNTTERKILYSIMDKPGISNSELSVLYNLNKSSIHRILKKYVENGIIEFKVDGKYKRCYLASGASENLKKYRQGQDKP
jgi:predicted transcriptional regulator